MPICFDRELSDLASKNINKIMTHRDSIESQVASNSIIIRRRRRRRKRRGEESDDTLLSRSGFLRVTIKGIPGSNEDGKSIIECQISGTGRAVLIGRSSMG